MELTINQALKKGVEAHKNGRFKEADQYYTAILSAQPKHSDANHNMGLLATDIGKVHKALPFFKIALKANPKVTQFWLSYIDALLKLGRMTDAKALFDKAKSKGLKGDGLEQLRERLNTYACKVSNIHEPLKNQLQPIINLYNQRQYQEALNQASELLKQFPNYVVLLNAIGSINENLGNLEESIAAYKKALSIEPNYAETYYKMGNALKQQGKIDEALKAYKKALTIKPDYPNAWYNIGIALQDQGNLDNAVDSYKKALLINPDCAEASFNIGNILYDQGKPNEALKAYDKVLLINPDYAEASFNIGIVLQEQGKFKAAFKAYKKALSIKPDYAEASNNIGITLTNQGKFKDAIKAYKNALSIKPDYAEAAFNLGNTLKDQGKLEEAIEAYTTTLSIKPNYAEAYYNLGLVLRDKGEMKEAIETFNKVISLKPDYVEAYWGLYGTANNLDEAKHWVTKSLEADPDYLRAKLTLSALQYYEGNTTGFKAIKKSTLQHNRYVRSFSWVFSLPKLPPLHFHRWSLFDQMIEISEKDRPFYEFGVWRAEAFKYLIRTFKKGYGFDTFEGLPEDWHDEKAGTYSSEGNIPEIHGGTFIVGRFEDTLHDFFSKNRPKASIINFDADLYSSTICALNSAKPVIDQHTILIFDEFIINENWEQDEYRALREFCNNNHYNYEVLAISFFTKQVAVRVIGI